MVNLQDSTSTIISPTGLWKKVFIALALCCLGLVMVNVFGYETAHWFKDDTLNHFLRGFVYSFIIVTGLWLMKRYLSGNPINIGYRTTPIAIKTFGLGIGLILVPIAINLLSTSLFGWAKISLSESTTFIYTFIMGFLATLLTDGLPEELIFRGFIYSHLNTRFSKLQSSLISLALFALFPIIIVSIQRLLGYPVSIGGADRITLSFVITMLLFGAFMQYLRVLTNSVWTSVGFHTVFVFMNQLIGIRPHNLIQLSDFTNEKPMQILMITLVSISFLLVLAYPRLSKKRINWNTNSMGSKVNQTDSY